MIPLATSRVLSGMAASQCSALLLNERNARAKAERARRQMHDIIAMVSHELRAPLHAILGWTELILAHHQDRQLLIRGLEIVACNARIQARLIDDLVDIVRLSSGRYRLDLQSVHLPTVVASAVETVQPAAAAKRIVITETLGESVSPIDADPIRLHQAFSNLLSNAVKFTPEMGHIRVTLRRTASRATVTVEDNGAGIAPALLGRVFDRFEQGDRSPSGALEGLGLGLWIVRNLVHLHGGTVWAESAGEGHGAKFTIALPLKGAGLHAHHRHSTDTTGPGGTS